MRGAKRLRVGRFSRSRFRFRFRFRFRIRRQFRRQIYLSINFRSGPRVVEELKRLELFKTSIQGQLGAVGPSETPIQGQLGAVRLSKTPIQSQLGAIRPSKAMRQSQQIIGLSLIDPKLLQAKQNCSAFIRRRRWISTGAL